MLILRIILLSVSSMMVSTIYAQAVVGLGSGPTKAYACAEAYNRIGNNAYAANMRIVRHDGCSCTKSAADNGGTYRFQCKATGMSVTGAGGKMISATGTSLNENAACATAKAAAESIARAGGLSVAQNSNCSCEDTPVSGYPNSSISCFVDAYAEPTNNAGVVAKVVSKIGDVTNKDLCAISAYIHMSRTMTGLVKRRTGAVKDHVLAMSDVKARALFQNFDSKLASGQWLMNDIRDHIEKCGVHFSDFAFR